MQRLRPPFIFLDVMDNAPVGIDAPVLHPDTVAMGDEKINEIIEEAAKKGEQVEVYKWELPPTPLDTPVPMHAVAKVVCDLRTETLRIMKLQPSWNNAKIQKKVLEKSVAFRYFAKNTHPHLFKLVVNKDTSNEAFDNLYKMMCIRKAHETDVDTLDEKTRQITSFFADTFWNPATAPGAAGQTK